MSVDDKSSIYNPVPDPNEPVQNKEKYKVVKQGSVSTITMGTSTFTVVTPEALENLNNKISSLEKQNRLLIDELKYMNKRIQENKSSNLDMHKKIQSIISEINRNMWNKNGTL